MTLGLVLSLGGTMGAVPLPLNSAAAQVQAGPQTMDEARDQGVLYYRKKRFKQAMPLLDRAYGMPGGAQDFSVVFYRGRTAYKLLLLEKAFEMASLATTLAGEDRRRAANAKEFQTELDSLFGKLTLKAAEGETNAEGRIFFETKTGIINREKKKRFTTIQERFKTTDITLPTTVYLPYGEYLANKVPVAIVQGEAAPEIEIFLQVQKTEEDDDNTLLWVGISAGTAAAVGLGVGAFFLFGQDEPAPETPLDIGIRN